MPCLVDWLPGAPHDLLAVGCWDGSVAIFKVVPGQAQQQQQQQQAGGGGGAAAAAQMFGLELLLHFTADVLPLRGLRWIPPAPCQSSIDSLQRHIIATGGHEATVRIWDLRCAWEAGPAACCVHVLLRQAGVGGAPLGTAALHPWAPHSSRQALRACYPPHAETRCSPSTPTFFPPAQPSWRVGGVAMQP